MILNADPIKKCGTIKIKALLRTVLCSPDFESALKECGIPPDRIISPLISFLYETDETVRWRAVAAVGSIVAEIAEQSVESARNIMRRLIWSLNDESGGIGWGAPEAMGEIMARSEKLALEYYCILLSYVDPEGNPLENDLLDRGVLWGIGRLAQARPELVRGCMGVLLKELSSEDPVKRSLALRAIGFLAPDPDEVRGFVEPLLNDGQWTRIYYQGEFVDCRTADIAAKVLASRPREGER